MHYPHYLHRCKSITICILLPVDIEDRAKLCTKITNNSPAPNPSIASPKYDFETR